MRRPLLPVLGLVLATLSCSTAPAATPTTVQVEVTREVPVTVTAPPPTGTPVPVILFEEDFEHGAGEWYLGTYPDSTAEVRSGELIVTILEPNWVWDIGHPSIEFLTRAFALEVDVRHISGAADSEAGVSFRRQDADNMALLTLSADGYISLAVIEDDEYSAIIPYARLRGGRPGSFHLRLEDDGSRVAAFSNDSLVFDLPMETLPMAGLALMVGTFDSGEATWAFDNLTIQALQR